MQYIELIKTAFYIDNYGVSRRKTSQPIRENSNRQLSSTPPAWKLEKACKKLETKLRKLSNVAHCRTPGGAKGWRLCDKRTSRAIIKRTKAQVLSIANMRN
jgi:hypothetical protein